MTSKSTPEPDRKELTDRQKLNVVSDTVVGPNIRLGDNLFQVLAIVVGALIGAGIGYLVYSADLSGPLIGSIAGVLVGLFGSGIFLMVYRAVQHARGKHD